MQLHAISDETVIRVFRSASEVKISGIVLGWSSVVRKGKQIADISLP